MKVIKDTMPEQYETKDGHLGYVFTSSFGSPFLKNGVLHLPIRPLFIFRVDKKDVGEYQCENTVEINVNTTKDEIYKSVHNHSVATSFQFFQKVRGQFAIPAQIAFKPPTVEETKDIIAEKLRAFVPK